MKFRAFAVAIAATSLLGWRALPPESEKKPPVKINPANAFPCAMDVISKNVGREDIEVDGYKITGNGEAVIKEADGKAKMSIANVRIIANPNTQTTIIVGSSAVPSDGINDMRSAAYAIRLSNNNMAELESMAEPDFPKTEWPVLASMAEQSARRYTAEWRACMRTHGAELFSPKTEPLLPPPESTPSPDRPQRIIALPLGSKVV